MKTKMNNTLCLKWWVVPRGVEPCQSSKSAGVGSFRAHSSQIPSPPPAVNRYYWGTCSELIA